MESAASRYEIGAIVIASDGEVGTVEEVVRDPATGEPSLLAVRLREGEGRAEVPFGMVDIANSTAREVRLLVDRSLLIGEATTGVTATTTATAAAATTEVGMTAGAMEAGDRLVIPTYEEVLVPSTHEVELGAVRIHKRVEAIPYETLVELQHDDVSVERVAIGSPITAMPAPRHEGNTLVIPVVEEIVVTEKRLVLREEIRVTRRQVTEQVPVNETLRREVVEIEDPDGGSFRASSGGRPSVTTATATAAPPAATDGPPLS